MNSGEEEKITLQLGYTLKCLDNIGENKAVEEFIIIVIIISWCTL